METKKTFYSEWAYVIGLVLLAGGTALMERANFGLSMVVAPAYLLHLKISQSLPFFTFGMGEYALQFVILILMGVVLREFRISYLGSFLTAIIYGFILDGLMNLVALIPDYGIPDRFVCYFGGMIISGMGIAFLFHTYLPPEAYELLVKELVRKYKWKVRNVKTIYDCSSLIVSVTMSFAFFGLGHFEGVKLGTIFCALINGTIIGLFCKAMDVRLVFKRNLFFSPFNSKKE